MDVKISLKQKMLQPDIGYVDVLVDNIFDFFLIESIDENGQVWVEDIESFSEEEWFDEELDRVSFSIVRSYGMDPINPYEGIQWSEMLLGEIPSGLLMQQIIDAGTAESQFVQVSLETLTVNGQERMAIKFVTIDPNLWIMHKML